MSTTAAIDDREENKEEISIKFAMSQLRNC